MRDTREDQTSLLWRLGLAAVLALLAVGAIWSGWYWVSNGPHHGCGGGLTATGWALIALGAASVGAAVVVVCLRGVQASWVWWLLRGLGLLGLATFLVLVGGYSQAFGCL